MNKSKKTDYKSTVIIMRDNTDWGKILFNACYCFNKRLADYWLKYVKDYNEGKLFSNDSEEKIKYLLNERKALIDERKLLHNNVKEAAKETRKIYKQYTNISLIGNFVNEWRNFSISDNIDKDKYYLRKKLIEQYYCCIKNENIMKEKEREHINKNLFKTRNYRTQAKNLQKMIELHKIPLARDINLDKDIIYNLLTSIELAERLMGLCINIINIYSEKEFLTLMNEQDREHVADYIFNYFNEFQHNYDFLAGCYEKKDNKLYLKNVETLKNKFYNGYYFTIKGFVRYAYTYARDEHFNIESVDNNWEEDEGNGNHGIDNYINTDNISFNIGGNYKNTFDDGMISFWNQCKNYLNNHIKDMSNELTEKMSKSFPDMKYYNSIYTNNKMINVLSETINGIDNELSLGKNVKSKLKNIIIDSMQGAENKHELNKSINYILEILENYINKFFVHNNEELFGKDYDYNNINFSKKYQGI